MRWLKQLDDEIAKLKRIVADLSRDKEMLQDVRKGRRLSACESSSRCQIKPESDRIKVKICDRQEWVRAVKTEVDEVLLP